jgi:hypothetical protein
VWPECQEPFNGPAAPTIDITLVQPIGVGLYSIQFSEPVTATALDTEETSLAWWSPGHNAWVSLELINQLTFDTLEFSSGGDPVDLAAVTLIAPPTTFEATTPQYFTIIPECSGIDAYIPPTNALTGATNNGDGTYTLDWQFSVTVDDNVSYDANILIYSPTYGWLPLQWITIGSGTSLTATNLYAAADGVFVAIQGQSTLLTSPYPFVLYPEPPNLT